MPEIKRLSTGERIAALLDANPPTDPTAPIPVLFAGVDGPRVIGFAPDAPLDGVRDLIDAMMACQHLAARLVSRLSALGRPCYIAHGAPF